MDEIVLKKKLIFCCSATKKDDLSGIISFCREQETELTLMFRDCKKLKKVKDYGFDCLISFYPNLVKHESYDSHFLREKIFMQK